MCAYVGYGGCCRAIHSWYSRLVERKAAQVCRVQGREETEQMRGCKEWRTIHIEATLTRVATTHVEGGISFGRSSYTWGVLQKPYYVHSSCEVGKTLQGIHTYRYVARLVGCGDGLLVYRHDDIFDLVVSLHGVLLGVEAQWQNPEEE